MLRSANAMADQLVDPHFAPPLVVVDDRRLLGRIGILVDRDPVDAVVGEQGAPFLEPPLVEQPRLAINERLDLARQAIVSVAAGPVIIAFHWRQKDRCGISSL